MTTPRRNVSARLPPSRWRRSSSLSSPASRAPFLLGRAIVRLVREVDARLLQRQEVADRHRPALVHRAELATRLRERLTPLGLRLGVDEIRDTFRLQQVQPAGEKSAPCELTGFVPAVHPNRSAIPERR